MTVLWEGPMSIAFYVSDSEAAYIEKYFSGSDGLREKISDFRFQLKENLLIPKEGQI